MFEFFRKYLEDKISITEADYELIESVCIIKKLRKHQFLLTEGDVCTYSGFVCKGFLLIGKSNFEMLNNSSADSTKRGCIKSMMQPLFIRVPDGDR
jgi:hypothetical protein